MLEKRAAYQETNERAQELERGAKDARAKLSALELRCVEKSAGMNLFNPGATLAGVAQQTIPAPYQGPDMEKIRAKTTQSLVDPQLVADGQAMDAQLMLHQLMTSDPVLSSKDPTEVINAYNMIARGSPNMVQSPLALQAMLRKYMEAGGLDPMDISNMATTDKAMAPTAQRNQNLMAG